MEPTRIQLIDTTLRDGEQAPGVIIPLAAKQALAHRLSQAGIDEIELGVPAMEERERALTTKLIGQLPAVRIIGWCRANLEDIQLAQDLGLQAVHISLPISAIQLDALNWSESQFQKRLETTLRYARTHFDFVSLGAADASRTPLRRLIEIGQRTQALGANRLRLADTVGCWTPSATHAVFQELTLRLPDLPLGIHAHNDLGMATANSLAAIEAGAQFADVTINGVGERAGNAALEQLATILNLQPQWQTKISTQYMCQLSWELQQAIGRPVSPDKPIVGRDVFTHESGIHVHSLLRNRRSYEAFDAAMVGRSQQLCIRIGKHSGKAALAYKLRLLGRDADSVDLDRLLANVKHQAQKKCRGLKDTELLRLFNAQQKKSLHPSGNL
jgi:homocitrate synthase NifV